MNKLNEFYGDSLRNANVTEILIDIFIKVRNQAEWKGEMTRSNVKCADRQGWVVRHVGGGRETKTTGKRRKEKRSRKDA